MAITRARGYEVAPYGRKLFGSALEGAPDFAACHPMRTYGFKNTHVRDLKFRALLDEEASEVKLTLV